MPKKVLALTTVNNTVPLKTAMNDILHEHGPVIELNKVFFSDYEDPDVPLDPLKEYAKKADLIMIDVRGDHRASRELFPVVRQSSATVVVLLGTSPDIMALTRMGKFSGEKLFKPGKPEKDFNVDDYLKSKKYAELTKKLGKFLPVRSVKDMRNWVLAQEYYTNGDSENLKNMLLFLSEKYLGTKLQKHVPGPVSQPDFGLYLPETGELLTDRNEYDKKAGMNPKKPVVGILIYGGMHFYDTAPLADAIYKRFMGQCNVVCIFSKAEYNILALEKYLPKADVIINFQFFRVHGGPFGGPPEKTYNYLKKLNAPLFLGLRSYETTYEKWQKEDTGINPLELILGVVLPELDGAFEPLLIGVMENMKDDALGEVRQTKILDDRMDRMVKRISNWMALKKKPNENKKIALLTYNYPPGEDNLANAGYLDVLESMDYFVKQMHEKGYKIDLPAKHIRELMLDEGFFNSPAYSGKRGIKAPVKEYTEWFETLPEKVRKNVIKHWGEPPGEIMTEGDDFILPGILLGNLFLGVQPSRGVHEDEEHAYHDKELPPHHQYLAFYRYLQKQFGANAVIHFGTHGSLEFTKGKEVALSKNCFPDILIGAMPHIYYYWVGNTSESTIAKRRSYAICLSHASPAMQTSGLYEKYIVLEDLLQQYEQSNDEATLTMIVEIAEELHLPDDPVQLSRELFRMKRKMIPHGLHVMDKEWSVAEKADYLTGVLRIDRGFPSLNKIISQHQHLEWEKIKHTGKGEQVEKLSRETVERLLNGEKSDYIDDSYRQYVESLVQRIDFKNESLSLFRVLEGDYLQPACGGDPVRDPDVYPTGRPMNAFNPTKIPTVVASERGKNAANQLVNQFLQAKGHYPGSVGIVLWAFETMKTGGDTISTIFHLLGLRMKHKKNVWFREFEVIPLSELNRPRIDVMVTICGIFRDTLGTHVELINRAFDLVASLDEPEEMNFIKKHRQKAAESNDEMAMARIFGPSPSEYGTSMRSLIETSNWEEEKQLVDSYDNSMNYAYYKGRITRSPDAFSKVASTVELVSQERDNHEYEVTDLDHYYEFFGGLARSVKEKRGENPEILLVDSTDDEMLVEDASENIERATRTRLLNPKWIEGMLSHEYHGASKIKDRVEYMMALAATTGKVKDWVFEDIANSLVFDEEMHNKLKENNKHATHKIEELMMETHHRGYWQTDQKNIEKLREIMSKTDSELE